MEWEDDLSFDFKCSLNVKQSNCAVSTDSLHIIIFQYIGQCIGLYVGQYTDYCYKFLLYKT